MSEVAGTVGGNDPVPTTCLERTTVTDSVRLDPERQLVELSVALWNTVPGPDAGGYIRPPRVGPQVDESTLQGLVRRSRATTLAALWPSLSSDQRAAAVFACSSPPTARDGAAMMDWLLALLLADRQAALLGSIRLSARQWQWAWHDPLPLLPKELRDGPAGAWLRSCTQDSDQREHIRQAAAASPMAHRLPIGLLMDMARPWRLSTVRAVTRHPHTSTTALLEIAEMPSLPCDTRARLAVHPAFPVERVPLLYPDAGGAAVAGIVSVEVSPARLLALLDQPLQPALARAFIRVLRRPESLMAEKGASEQALVRIFTELDVNTLPHLVDAVLDSPHPAGRRALAHVVNDAQVLGWLASGDDSETRAIASRRVVQALAG